MANLVKTTMIDRLRQQLDEITLSGERVSVDTDLEDTASSNFSDADLGDRLDDAARYVAALVRPMYVPDLIETNTKANLPNDINAYLGSRVRMPDGTTAKRRTFAAHRKLEATGVSASATHPVFIIEDAEVATYPNTLLLSYVVPPEDVEDLDTRLEAPVLYRAYYNCLLTLAVMIPMLVESAEAAKQEFIKSITPYIQPRIS